MIRVAGYSVEFVEELLECHIAAVVFLTGHGLSSDTGCIRGVRETKPLSSYLPGISAVQVGYHDSEAD